MALYTYSQPLGSVLIVHCEGRIVFGEETTSLRLFVMDLLNKSNQIVLDLGRVSFIDSGGLGALVSLYVSARRLGGTIKLARLQSQVNDLLQLSKLAALLEIFDSAEDAAASFSTETGRAHA